MRYKNKYTKDKVKMLRVRVDNIFYTRLIQLSNRYNNCGMSEIFRIAVTEKYLRECINNNDDNINTNDKEV